MSIAAATPSPLEETTCHQTRMAALGPCYWRCRLSCCCSWHHRSKLDSCLGRIAPRRAVLCRVLSAKFHGTQRRHHRRHPRKPLDDVVSTVIGIASRFRWVSEPQKTSHRQPGLLFLPRNPGIFAQFPGNHSGDLLRQAVRFWSIRRHGHAVGGHRRILRQASCRRHRGYGLLASGSRAC
jgi:hypothetical protein